MLRYSSYQSIYDQSAKDLEITQSKFSQAIHHIKSYSVNKLLGVLFVFLLGFTSAFTVFAGSPEQPVGERNVIVQSGDSLWNIATNHKPAGMDTREYVKAIAKYNGIQGPDIQYGDVIALPLY
ncbi:LysM peptidoglycan-binding domain-containing protein [Paenibacillus lemnae]|uniref:LysM peptidoglycan-binding domain-containing protein n=1 Tax=Paenibacillus lemnae TaxID=1330551 RepID=A0A848M7W7_PAELE|nr:LysM peptidoglycan-binding domain-containing protein [Paenibacillus lemnae]NMO95973.1 LysM peptidoglycan-binding domain-containing protein [Paenibacillus lemnae]